MRALRTYYALCRADRWLRNSPRFWSLVFVVNLTAWADKGDLLSFVAALFGARFAASAWLARGTR